MIPHLPRDLNKWFPGLLCLIESVACRTTQVWYYLPTPHLDIGTVSPEGLLTQTGVSCHKPVFSSKFARKFQVFRLTVLDLLGANTCN